MNEQPNRSDVSRRTPWLWILLAVAVGLLTVRLTLPTNKGIGKTLPLLSLQPLTFEGSTIALDDLRGQVVVLNFWGTWCPPCRRELPHVAKLASHYADDRRCRVLAVSCGTGGPDPVSSLPDLKNDTEELLAHMHLVLVAYADPDARTRRAVDQVVGFGGYPTTLVLDRNGVIRHVWTGYAAGDEKEVARLVESLLADTQG
jgi:cytochrome c biogenesis protein CcmG, thiol:disulfide interchange protein DsbE